MNKKLTNYIIPPWDPRYGKLGHLWQKYNYSNIQVKRSDWGIKPFYFIPPELVLTEYYSSDGDSRAVGIKEYDSTQYDNWLNSNRTVSYALKHACNLTLQEYFDLLVLHINNIHDRPRCKNCGAPLNWTGRIYNGYGHMYWTDMVELFCSMSCKSTYISTHQIHYKSNFNSWISQIKAARNNYLSLNLKSNIVYFYVTWLDNYDLKFGITTSIKDRIHRSESKDHVYLTPHILISGTKIDMANLEALIKFQFKGNEYLNSNDLPKFFEVYRSILSKGIYDPFED